MGVAGLEEARDATGEEDEKELMDLYEEEQGYITKFGLNGTVRAGARLPAGALITGVNASANAAPPKKPKKKKKGITVKLI